MMQLVRYLLCLWLAARSSTTAYNMSAIGELLQHVGRFHNFSSLVLFVGASVEPLELNALLRQLHGNASPLAAQYLFSAAADQPISNLLRHHIDDDCLSVLLCASSEDAVWRLADTRLRKLRQTKLIVALPAASNEPQRRLGRVFQQLWDLQFVHAVVLSNRSLYGYTPYPQLSSHQLSEPWGDIFPPRARDLQGYVIETSVENDIPRIFCIEDSQGEVHFHGFAYQIFRHFLRRLNATLRISNAGVKRAITSNVNMSNILHRIGRRQLEISMHPYPCIGAADGIIGYPIFKVHHCLIVPVRNEIPRYMYLLRPFEWSAWLAVLIAIAYVTAILVWTEPRLRPELPLLERVSRCCLESITQLLFLPSTFQLHAPKCAYFLIRLQLLILGFFVTSWYSNLLSSFLTTFLVGDQLDSFDDLLTVKLPIMLKHYETHMFMEQIPQQFQQKVERLLVPVDASVLVAHMLSFNRSFAYPVTKERWTFLALQQQYANKPIYRYSRICFGKPVIGYPMRLDSHLEHPLTQFIMDVQMAGLDHYWLTSDFKAALKAGYVHLIDNVLLFKALDLPSLRVAFYVVTCGWMAALLAFLVEYFKG